MKSHSNAFYISTASSLQNIGRNMVLCSLPDATRTRCIDVPIASCLQYAQQPRKREQLVFYLMESQHVSSVKATEWFDEAVKSGLLGCLRIEGPSHAQGFPVAIRDLYCVSARRPAALTSLYQSVRRQSISHGRTMAMTIVDDNHDPSSMGAYRDVVSTWERVDNVSLRYSDRPMRRAFCALLAKQGISPTTAHYALLGMDLPGVVSTGSAKNCALLGSSGNRFLLLDDDVLLETGGLQGKEPLTVRSDLDFRRPHFFGSPTDLQSHFPLADSLDVLSEHERYLGKPLLDMLADSNELTYSAPISGVMRQALSQENSPRILASHPGVSGATGMHTGTFWLMNEGTWSAELRINRSALATALSNQYLHSAALGPTITDHPFCQSMALALANDYQLPCFLPSGRNQDGVFGLLLQSMYPASIIHLPFAQCHAGAASQFTMKAPQARIAEMVLSLISKCLGLRAGRRNPTLSEIGETMKMLIAGSTSDFEQLLAEFQKQRVGYAMARISALLDSGGTKSDMWESALKSLWEESRRAINSGQEIIPLELRNKDYEGALVLAHDIASKTADMFSEWSHLRAASEFLQGQGETLAKII